MKKIVEHTVKVFDGIEYPVTITRHIGRAAYERNDEIVEADELHELDYGAKRGVSRVYVYYPQGETPEHKAKCREDLMAIAGSIIRKSG